MRASEPLVVVLGRGREALADVLVAGAQASGTALHERYPGLTIALVATGNHYVARFRDGTELSVAGTPEELARRLYRWWLISPRPAPPTGRAVRPLGRSRVP